MTKKHTCPAHLRAGVEFDIDLFQDYTVVILEHTIYYGRQNYMRPDVVWDYLHENIINEWHPCLSNSFGYLCDQPYGRMKTLVLFKNKTDAMKFVLNFGGDMLPYFADEFRAEKTVAALLHDAHGLSRKDRRTKFPGLDEFLDQYVPGASNSATFTAEAA